MWKITKFSKCFLKNSLQHNYNYICNCLISFTTLPLLERRGISELLFPLADIQSFDRNQWILLMKIQVENAVWFITCVWKWFLIQLRCYLQGKGKFLPVSVLIDKKGKWKYDVYAFLKSISNVSWVTYGSSLAKTESKY